MFNYNVTIIRYDTTNSGELEGLELHWRKEGPRFASMTDGIRRLGRDRDVIGNEKNARRDRGERSEAF